MKTRFLDWTEDIYVALYFACLQKKDNDSQNNDLRSVWLLNASAVEDFKAQTGNGLSGKLNGEELFGGNSNYISTKAKISEMKRKMKR